MNGRLRPFIFPQLYTAYAPLRRARAIPVGR
jgi:hypothetical protein